MAKTTWRKGTPLGSNILQQLRRFVKEKGDKAAAEFFGIGRISVVRAAAGLGLRRGTAFVIETKLGELSIAHAA